MNFDRSSEHKSLSYRFDPSVIVQKTVPARQGFLRRMAATTTTDNDTLMKPFRHFADYSQMEADTTRRLEKLAFQHGQNYDSYLVTEPNRQYLWTNDFSGVVGFKLLGKYVKVVGGLIADDADKRPLLKALLAFIDQNRYSLSMFNISDQDLPLFREFGFQPNKIGEDALIELQTSTWSGKKFEWVRRQSNFVRRANVVISEPTSEQLFDECDSKLITELQEVSDLHLAGKPQKQEMGLFVGHFLPGYMHRRRAFIARTENGTGRIDGFIICTPSQFGNQWSMEMYRQRPDAVRGVVPALMHHAMQQMKEEGVEFASLCLIPALRCDERIEGDRAATRWSMMLFNRLLSSVYDTQGLYHYKSRFRPEFVNRYVCCYPKGSLGGSLAFLSALGILNVKPGHVLKNAIRHLHPSRWTIARPKRKAAVASQPSSSKSKAA